MYICNMACDSDSWNYVTQLQQWDSHAVCDSCTQGNKSMNQQYEATTAHVYTREVALVLPHCHVFSGEST